MMATPLLKMMPLSVFRPYLKLKVFLLIILKIKNQEITHHPIERGLMHRFAATIKDFSHLLRHYI
jgi:hypothetical protein